MHRLWSLAPHSSFAASNSPRIDLQASTAHSRHFPGQKLRLGGDALGADPTYLLYLPSRSRGGLRRIDFGAWPRATTLPPTIFPRIDPQASAAHSWHFPGQKLRLGGDALGADPTYLLYLAYRSRGELRRIDFGAWPRTATLPPTIFPPNRPASLFGTELPAWLGRRP